MYAIYLNNDYKRHTLAKNLEEVAEHLSWHKHEIERGAVPHVEDDFTGQDLTYAALKAIEKINALKAEIEEIECTWYNI